MGLLDVLNSEQGRLGLGLLAAAGGRSDGAGFGQRMAEGLGSYDHWKKQQAQAKLQKMQEEEMQAQVEARKAKAVEDARIKALVAGAGVPRPGMGAGLPAGMLPGEFDIGGVPALQQPGKIDFQGLMRQGVPFELVKQLADSQNLGRQKVARTTEIEGPNGQKIVQGFDDYGQRVGQGENGYIAPVIVNQGGSTGFQKPVAGSSFPISMSPSERDASARGWASNALARDRFNYDKTQDTAKGPAAAGKETPADTRTREADDALATIAQAEKLIDGSTGSYLGAGADETARLFGISTKGAQNAAKLKALEGALISKMPKMSGPQSDKDVLLYKQMAGQIGDSTIPAPTKRAAIETIKDIQKRYASPEAIARSDGSAKPSASMSSLPPAQQHKGRTIRDTATDKMLKSNGMSWVEVQ